MIVLDSLAVLALLKDEPAAEQVIRLVTSEEDASLTALGVSEVLYHLVRLSHHSQTHPATSLWDHPWFFHRLLDPNCKNRSESR